MSSGGSLNCRSTDDPITKEERAAITFFREFVETVPTSARKNLTLYRAVELLKERHKIKPMTCQAVSDDLCASLAANGKSDRYVESTIQEMKRFNADYGDWLTCDVPRNVVKDFLQNLVTVPRRKLARGENFTPKPLSNSSKIHYNRTLTMFFNHSIEMGASIDNPAKGVFKGKIKTKETAIFTPSQVANLLAHAEKKILPGMAIAFFAGLRPDSELLRLDWSDVNMTDGTIQVKAGNAKTATRRSIAMTENLRQWLMPYVMASGSVVKSKAIMRRGRSKMRDAAGMKIWPQDVARHSYASYFYEHFEDGDKLQKNLGHTSLATLHSYYNQLVSKKHAAAYWEICPTCDGDIVSIAAG